MNVENITRLFMINPVGVVFLVVFFACLFHLDQQTKKRKRELDESAKENPKLHEKVEIEKSKISSDFKRNLDITNKLIVLIIAVLIFAVIVTLLLIHSMNKYNLDYEFVNRISLLMFVFVVVIFGAAIKCTQNKAKKIVFNFLENKYGVIEKLSTPSTVIVEGKKSEVGNIRRKYSFSYRINKYNCMISNYSIEKLCKHRRYRNRNSAIYRGRTYFRYEKLTNVMEYCYNLKSLGLNNINNDILLQSNIRQVIESLAEIKEIKVSIKNEYLTIEKETVLNNYNTKDALRDVEDVELFYNKVVKKIMEEVK